MHVDQPVVNGRRGLGGELLEHDGADEHREMIEAIARGAEAAGTVLLDDGGEHGSRRISARRAAE